MPSLSQIAKHLGVSKARAGQWKLEGMPCSSLKIAAKWRSMRPIRRASTKGPAVNLQFPPKGKPRKKSAPANTGDSLEDALKDAQTICKDAFTAYQDALSNGDIQTSARLSEFNKALDGRLKAEKAAREEQERRGILVPKAVITESVLRSIETIIRRLNRLPQEAGPQCNPDNPLMATTILQRSVDEIKTAAQAAMRDLA